MWRICTGTEEDGVEASKRFRCQEKRCKVLYLSRPFPAPVSSATKDKIMKLSSTTSTFAYLELFAIQYDFLTMQVKSSSLMLMLALSCNWKRLAILIQHSQLLERWDTFRYGPIHCLVRLPAGCCLCFVIASHMLVVVTTILSFLATQ